MAKTKYLPHEQELIDKLGKVADEINSVLTEFAPAKVCEVSIEDVYHILFVNEADTVSVTGVLNDLLIPTPKNVKGVWRFESIYLLQQYAAEHQKQLIGLKYHLNPQPENEYTVSLLTLVGSGGDNDKYVGISFTVKNP